MCTKIRVAVASWKMLEHSVYISSLDDSPKLFKQETYLYMYTSVDLASWKIYILLADAYIDYSVTSTYVMGLRKL